MSLTNCTYLWIPKAHFCFQSLSAIQDEADITSTEMKIVEYGEDITELYNALMTLEMQLVEQLEVRPGPWAHR